MTEPVDVPADYCPPELSQAVTSNWGKLAGKVDVPADAVQPQAEPAALLDLIKEYGDRNFALGRGIWPFTQEDCDNHWAKIVAALNAHPPKVDVPADVAEVASKSVEYCMTLAVLLPEAGDEYFNVLAKIEAAIVAYGGAQWNAAIEAAQQALSDHWRETTHQGPDLRGLKR